MRAWQLVTVRSVGAEDGAARATPTGCIIRAVATASDDVLGEAPPTLAQGWSFPAALFAGTFGFAQKDYFDLGADRQTDSAAPQVKF